MSSIVLVGAGPAGIRAASTLVKYGHRPVVIDEAARAGGQIYRRQPQNFHRKPAELYGSEASRAIALHEAADSLEGNIKFLPESLVWNADRTSVDVLQTKTGMSRRISWNRMILATGATDRIFPLPGWTLPGVFSLGGSQVALKFQGCSIGRRVVFMGTGPLLYLVAYQYAKAGAEVAAVLDTSSLRDQISASRYLLSQPSTFAKGLFLVSWLQANGISIRRNVTLLRVLGATHVEGIEFSQGSSKQIIKCDAVGFGYALRSETQLADLMGCDFEYSKLQRAHVPKRDDACRSSVSGVYLAGDGAGILGADAAEWAGELSALTLLSDEGADVDQSRVSFLQKRLKVAHRFRRGLEKAFPTPESWAADATNQTVICRCENITAGDIRSVVKQTGATELNRLKALSRVGMGRCQGRMCGLAAAEILAHSISIPIEQVGRLRTQAPIKPIPLHLSASAETQL